MMESKNKLTKWYDISFYKHNDNLIIGLLFPKEYDAEFGLNVLSELKEIKIRIEIINDNKFYFRIIDPSNSDAYKRGYWSILIEKNFLESNEAALLLQNIKNQHPIFLTCLFPNDGKLVHFPKNQIKALKIHTCIVNDLRQRGSGQEKANLN